MPLLATSHLIFIPYLETWLREFMFLAKPFLYLADIGHEQLLTYWKLLICLLWTLNAIFERIYFKNLLICKEIDKITVYRTNMENTPNSN